MSVKIAYLVQGRAAELPRWECETPEDAYLCTLSWDRDFSRSDRHSGEHIFLPGSTWAQGRNLQLEVAKNASDFDYYFFFDGDARFENGANGLLEFQEKVTQLRPAIALPLTDVVRESGRYDPKLQVQKPVGFDQVAQAYSRRSIEDGIVLPLMTDLDERSWWYACEINQYLCLRYYPDDLLQFNDVIVHNDHHFSEMASDMDHTSDSSYRGGIDEAGMQEAREIVIRRFGEQPRDIGSFFETRQPRKPLSLSIALNRVRRLARGQ